MNFSEELTRLINKHGVDNDLETPDYVLAEYVISNLNSMKNVLTEKGTE